MSENDTGWNVNYYGCPMHDPPEPLCALCILDDSIKKLCAKESRFRSGLTDKENALVDSHMRKTEKESDVKRFLNSAVTECSRAERAFERVMMRMRFYESLLKSTGPHARRGSDSCAFAKRRGLVCCNPSCGGVWGTGCYCCHSGRFAAEASDEEIEKRSAFWEEKP